MDNKDLKVGAILENGIRQFAKIISIKDSIYNLSYWTPYKANAEEATVGYVRVNIYGLESAGVRVVTKAPKSKDETSAPVESKEEEFSKAKLKKMTSDEIKSLAEKLGVSAEGKKADVIERILEI